MRRPSGFEKAALGLSAVFLLVCGLWFWRQRAEERPWWVVTGRAPAQSSAVSADVGEEYPESLLPDEVIDLNTAPVKDLARLPQIGEKRAADIVDWREKNGPFQSAEDLMEVSGIGQGIFDMVKDYVTVEHAD